MNELEGALALYDRSRRPEKRPEEPDPA
jgi:hypothetical protein